MEGIDALRKGTQDSLPPPTMGGHSEKVTPAVPQGAVLRTCPVGKPLLHFELP